MKYPYRVFQTQVEEHVFWVAECPALKGCVGQGDTPEAALTELAANEQSWLELAEEYGMEIPEVPIEKPNAYSGKLTLRVAPHVHEDAAEFAKEQGVSLNQYINDAIVSQNARMESIGFIAPELKKTVYYIKELFTAPEETQSEGCSIVTLFTPQAQSGGYKLGQSRQVDPHILPIGVH